MIHNGTLYWQNCSMCGARWIGTHTCDPTPRPTVRNITLPPMSKLVIGRVEAENAQLRAELATAEAKLATLIEMFVAEGYSRDGIMRSLSAPHSADQLSAPPPARNPATPPSGR